jgi:uncharacterized membrane protein (UPF0127 family)
MALGLGLLLASVAGAQAPPASAATATATPTPTQLKDFPRDSLVIQRSSGRDLFQIWVATTPAQHEQGLMWVRQLAPDQGMLFLLESPRPMTMWMKNTYMPLDMVFADEAGRIVGIARNTTPLSTTLISSPSNVAAVLEILAGESNRRGITVGDRLVHPAFGNR